MLSTQSGHPRVPSYHLCHPDSNAWQRMVLGGEKLMWDFPSAKHSLEHGQLDAAVVLAWGVGSLS